MRERRHGPFRNRSILCWWRAEEVVIVRLFVSSRYSDDIIKKLAYHYGVPVEVF